MECDLHAPPVAGPAWCIPRIVGAACMRPANIAAPPIAGPAWCLPRIVGRGLGPAAPMIFLNFIMCGGRNRPPYRARGMGNQPKTPRGAHPCREAYMPPLQTPGTASITPGTGGGGRFTGRMHAAPTNRPGTAGKWQNRCLPQTSAAGVNARPTGRRKRPYSPQPPRGRKPPPGVLFTPWASAPPCRPCRGAAPRGWSRCRRPGGGSPKMR